MRSNERADDTVIDSLIGSRTRRLGLAGLLAAAMAATAAHAAAPPTAPPAEVAQLLNQMAGRWSARGIGVTIQGRAAKSDSDVTCEKTTGGWALRCRVEVNTGGHRQELLQILGWDRPSGEFHLFSVSDSGDSHDHHGSLDGKTLNLEYRGTHDGKAFVEQLAFAIKGPKELLWKDTCTLGGEVVFSGEGIYRK
jgi:hypothetical protein